MTRSKLIDPERPDCTFARYKADTYLTTPDPDSERAANAATGLLISGLLKRFESPTHILYIIERLINIMKNF